MMQMDRHYKFENVVSIFRQRAKYLQDFTQRFLLCEILSQIVQNENGTVQKTKCYSAYCVQNHHVIQYKSTCHPKAGKHLSYVCW